MLLAAILLPSLLAGCTAPGPGPGLHDEPDCDAAHVLVAALDHLATQAHEDGGFAAYPGSDPDVRITSWVLLAAALARRAGYEGHLDPTDHLIHLKSHAHELVREGYAIDSAANNLSLARAAMQTWGLDPAGVRVDPNHTIAQAWETHYNDTTGAYGHRLNEHLFGTFASILFEPPGPRRDHMADYAGNGTSNPHLADHGLQAYTFDAWFAAYGRIALGPDPANITLANALDQALDDHIDPDTGGVRGFQTATVTDSSSTAAALTRWALIDPDEDWPQRDGAVAYLCQRQLPNGAIQFSEARQFATIKTTAEVVIALALHESPIPLVDPHRPG